MAKIGVLLSGCGVQDGSEIHEAVLTLLALDRLGAKMIPIAPFMDQLQVMNHRTNEPIRNQTRRVEIESARIARGATQNIEDITADDIDGLILPGGLGAAKNLCSYATEGANMNVHAEVSRLLLEMAQRHKPVGAICIAPVIVAKVYGGAGIPVRLTIGNDPKTAEVITGFGARHMPCAVTDIVLDDQYQVVSTPAYMLAKSIQEVATGIDKLTHAVIASHIAVVETVD